MITNGYTDLTTFKAWLGIGDAIDDAVLERTVEAASRMIDGYCRRRFYTDAVPSVHYYRSNDGWRVYTADFLTTESVTVVTDDNDDSAFETTWTAAEYQLEPANGQTYTAIAALTRRFPVYRSGRNAVKVTATWGFPTVPVQITEATLILGSRLFKRKDSPEGIIGFGELGGLRITPNDKDVCALIQPYVKAWIV